MRSWVKRALKYVFGRREVRDAVNQAAKVIWQVVRNAVIEFIERRIVVNTPPAQPTSVAAYKYAT